MKESEVRSFKHPGGTSKRLVRRIKNREEYLNLKKDMISEIIDRSTKKICEKACDEVVPSDTPSKGRRSVNTTTGNTPKRTKVAISCKDTRTLEKIAIVHAMYPTSMLTS